MTKALILLFFSFALFAQDISGIYKGTLTVESGDGSDGTGYIVVKQTGEALTITAGPGPEKQYPTVNLKREGGQLRFEVVLPDDENRVMKFDLLLKDKKLTGTITMSGGNGTNVARLDLDKQ